jgi:hypothetical protein
MRSGEARREDPPDDEAKVAMTRKLRAPTSQMEHLIETALMPRFITDHATFSLVSELYCGWIKARQAAGADWSVSSRAWVLSEYMKDSTSGIDLESAPRCSLRPCSSGGTGWSAGPGVTA